MGHHATYYVTNQIRALVETSRRSTMTGRVRDIAQKSKMAEGRTLSDLSLSVGYDEDFVSPVDEDFTCSICHVALREPVLTRCGHRFCRQCLQQCFTR